VFGAMKEEHRIGRRVRQMVRMKRALCLIKTDVWSIKPVDQKSPILYQKSLEVDENSPVVYQKSPIVCKKSPVV